MRIGDIKDSVSFFVSSSLGKIKKVEGTTIIDKLSFGKERTSCSFFVEKIHAVLHWVYNHLKKVLEGILSVFYFSSLKSEETVLERYEKNLKNLKTYKEFFEKNKDNKDDLKKWWEGIFFSLDSEMQKLFILQDIMTYCEGTVQDRKVWAEKNYEQHKIFSEQFVGKLECIFNDEGEQYDPFSYLPTYIANVQKILKEEIKKMKESHNK